GHSGETLAAGLELLQQLVVIAGHGQVVGRQHVHVGRGVPALGDIAGGVPVPVPLGDGVVALGHVRRGVDGDEVGRIVGEAPSLLAAPVLRAGVPGVAEGDDVVDLHVLAQVPLDRGPRVRVMQDPVGGLAVGPILVGDLHTVTAHDLVTGVAA